MAAPIASGRSHYGTRDTPLLSSDTAFFRPLVGDVQSFGDQPSLVITSPFTGAASAPASVTNDIILAGRVNNVPSEIWDVFPLQSPSIFDNDTGITNGSATWRIVEEYKLDGTFRYYDGGGFSYEPGQQSGLAYFVYEIIDYDGIGGTTQATVYTQVGVGFDQQASIADHLQDPNLNATLINPQGVFPTDQQLRDFGYILGKDHGLVGDGVTDNASAFVTFIDAVKAESKVGYIHYSDNPYMTSDCLTVVHLSRYDTGGDYPFEFAQLVGGTNPATFSGGPTIKLTPNAPGYESDKLKPMLYWQMAKPADGVPVDPWVTQPNPLNFPTGWTDGTGNLYQGYMENLTFDTNNNPGAVGVVMFGAQMCWMNKVKVICAGSKRGFSGFPATSYPSMDIEVDGGGTCDIGVDFTIAINDGAGRVLNSAACELIVGLKITGCTIPLQATDISSPATIVGFDIETAGTVYQTENNQNMAGPLVLVDGRVTITGGGNPIAFNNPTNEQMYLHNVYVTGTSNLVDSGSESTVTGTGTWKRIKHYSYNDQTVWTEAGYNVGPTQSMVDGVITGNGSTPEPYTVIENDVADPTVEIKNRHISKIPTVDDGIPFIDAVAEYSVNNTAASDDYTIDSRVEIQAALDAGDRVFLRKGNYNISKSPLGDYGIKLNEGQVLFSMYSGGHTFSATTGTGAFFRAHDSWLPTSYVTMIDTTDSATGSCTVANISCELGGNFYTGTGESPTLSNPPPHEWWGGIKIRTRNTLVWGFNCFDQYRYYGDVPALNGKNPPTNIRYSRHILGSGGGKIYGSGQNNQRWSRNDARGMMIEGPNTGPIICYGHNFEISKGASGDVFREMTVSCEATNADNIVIFSQKKEGRSGNLEVTNGNNIGFFGAGVQDYYINDAFAFYGNSDDILVGISTRRYNDGTDGGYMVKEDITGEPLNGILKDRNHLNVYSRGDFNMEGMFPVAFVEPAAVASVDVGGLVPTLVASEFLQAFPAESSGSSDSASLISLVAGPYIVDPIEPDSFLANDSYITAPGGADYIIVSSDLPDGSILWGRGGTMNYNFVGVTPGVYEFKYKVINIDGIGTEGPIVTATVTVN